MEDGTVVHIKLSKEQYDKLLILKDFFKEKSNNSTGNKIIHILHKLLEYNDFSDTIIIQKDGKLREILL